MRAERDVLKAAAMASTPAGSEWIVRLFYSFQDRDHLYLVCYMCSLVLVAHNVVQVLEFMGGGDLLNLLIERDVFEEDFTRFYVAEASVYCDCTQAYSDLRRWYSQLKPATSTDSFTVTSSQT